MSTNALPTRDEVTSVIESLISEKMSRQDVSAWASNYIDDDSIEVTDMQVWEAIKKLGAADLISVDRPFLYEIEDFQLWLKELNEPPA